MKKIAILCIIITFLSLWFFNSSFAWDDEKKEVQKQTNVEKIDETYFVVTAYYSPLPGQEYYLKWNYEDEVILNWKWIKWASWKKVFSWMLASPESYKFGTKIYLEWLWVWSVEDRWWAIVSAWERWYEYDRIDVWMWYWDEWLKRALYWWKRKVKWQVLVWWSSTDLDIKKIPAPNWTVKNLKKVPNIFNIWIWKESDSELIKDLQKFLKENSLYKGEIDWIYNDEILKIVYKFQLENKIVKKESDYWAWYWWINTRKIALKKYLEWDFGKSSIKNQPSPLSLSLGWEGVATKKINNTNLAKSFEWIKFWDVSPKVRELQITLKKLGFFEWKDTAIFWEQTKKSIIAFQKSKKIIRDENDIWAGNIWPKTIKKLEEEIKNIQTKKSRDSL